MLFRSPFGDAANCTSFNRWPYGMENRMGYAQRVSEEQMKKNLAARGATYLLGELDTLPIAGFDASCPAMAQGPHRLARGRAYTDYLKQHHGINPAFMVIPLCGHNARCMFTADAARPVLFLK